MCEGGVEESAKFVFDCLKGPMYIGVTIWFLEFVVAQHRNAQLTGSPGAIELKVATLKVGEKHTDD